MTRLRENTGVVLWILVFAFGVIWVLQDSGGLEHIGADRFRGDAAMVDGEVVTQQEYQQAVDAQRDQFRAQTGQELSPEELDQLRESVFDALVEDRLRLREMNRLGITVSDEEVEELILGDDPHPIIRTYFGDGEGGVDHQLLRSFIQSPEARQDWIQIEEFIRSQRRQEKLDNLITSTVHVSNSEVEEVYRRRNVEIDAEYIALPYAQVPAEEVEVTEADLRDYYNANREDFRRGRTATVEFVTESKAPTPEDTARVVEELEALRQDFAEAEDDELFVQRNASQRPFTEEFMAPPQMDPDVASAVFADPTPGTIVGPVFSEDMVHLVKIRDVQETGDTYVRARHILFEGDGPVATQRAESVLAELEDDADFAEMAQLHSEGPTGPRGGNLGWFGEGQMVDEFAQAALNAPIGQPIGPVETQFGMHLILVEDRTNMEAQIADLAYDMRPSPATLSEIEDRLGDISYYADDGDFRDEAARHNLEVQQTRVEEGQRAIPGIGQNPAVNRFIERGREGQVSDVMETRDRFVVLHITNVERAGYRPFEEVQAEIRPRVEQQKRQEYQLERLRQAYQETGTLEGAAQALNVDVQSIESLMHDTRVIPQIGHDQTFIGTVMGLSEQATSRPVGGENAAFILRVTNIEEPEPMDATTRRQLRVELEQQRRAEVRQRWIQSLREQADIEDRRDPVRL